MPFIDLPEFTRQNLWLYALLIVITPMLGLSEWKGWSTLKYSKFRSNTGMSSRVGMFILYFVPVLAHAAACFFYEYQWSFAQRCLAVCVLLHFLKRCAESLFLHRYAGPIDRLTVFQIAFFYSAVAWGAAYFNQFTPDVKDGVLVLGLLFFGVGIIGNFVHHKILADMRRNNLEYFIPMGGMFRWVSCPHYLFEVLGWLGMALISKQPFLYLTFLAMTFYLMARSHKAQLWYLSHFENYPKERRAMIPRIF